MAANLSLFGIQALAAVDRILAGARAGDLESETLDCKEDPSRRGPHGRRAAGARRDDAAARIIADAACCLANQHGGSLLVGFDDKAKGAGAVTGTALDARWLRERVRELTTPRLTVSVVEHQAADQRVLVVEVPRKNRRSPSPRPCPRTAASVAPVESARSATR